jgi:hypothetical protein
VFWQGYGDRVDLRFSGFQMTGAPLACVTQVAHVADAGSLPLWVDLQVPADWTSQHLYETMRAPRIFNR